MTDNTALMRRLAHTWKERREGQGWKPGTKTHAKMQLEFFIGASAACSVTGPQLGNMQLLLLALGKDSYDLWGKRDGEVHTD